MSTAALFIGMASLAIFLFGHYPLQWGGGGERVIRGLYLPLIRDVGISGWRQRLLSRSIIPSTTVREHR